MVTHLDAVIITGMLAHVGMVSLTSVLIKGRLQRAIWSRALSFLLLSNMVQVVALGIKNWVSKL